MDFNTVFKNGPTDKKDKYMSQVNKKLTHVRIIKQKEVKIIQ